MPRLDVDAKRKEYLRNLEFFCLFFFFFAGGTWPSLTQDGKRLELWPVMTIVSVRGLGMVDDFNKAVGLTTAQWLTGWNASQLMVLM